MFTRCSYQVARTAQRPENSALEMADRNVIGRGQVRTCEDFADFNEQAEPSLLNIIIITGACGRTLLTGQQRQLLNAQ